MKILKYKTIENIKYVPKGIPITKRDIKIIEKEENVNEFDIFESKEYAYKEVKKDEPIDSIKSKEDNNISDMIDEVEKKYISTENNIINSIDISKELDEDIYSDIKVNIEKSLEDDVFLDDPYKAAVRLSKEDSDKAQKKQLEEKNKVSEIETKSLEEMLEENEKNDNNKTENIIESSEIIVKEEKNENEIINKPDVEKVNNDSIIKKDNSKENSTSSFKNKIITLYKNIFAHPEEIEEKLSKIFGTDGKLAFLSALIIGLITHITFITSTIMSQDGLWNSMDYTVPTDWEVALGRWGIFYVDKIFEYLAIPSLTTIIGIVFIAISALLVVNLLKLKNKITVFLTSAIFAVSPALTATFTYIYTSVAYCSAMLISVIIVCLIFKKRGKLINLVLATGLFIFLLGIYQSYIGVVVGLTIIRLVRDLLDKEEKIGYFFLHGIMLIIVVIVGGLSYSQITNMILESKNMNLASYKGMESISVQNSISSINKTIPNAYKDFEDFFFTDEILKNTNYSRQEFFKVMFISTIVLELIAIIINKVWKNPLRVLFIIALTIMLPVGLNSIDLLATDTKMYLLTGAQLILVLPFAMMIYEMSGNKITFVFKWASLISAFLIVFTYYLADNTSYMVLKLKYDQAINTTIRMMERIEETEDYSPDKPIMIAGIIEENNRLFIPTHKLKNYTLGDIFDNPVFHGSYSGMEGTWTKFINTYMGLNVQFCNTTSYNDIVDSIYFKEMNVFPEENSVKMIYGVMVVKLSNDPVRP